MKESTFNIILEILTERIELLNAQVFVRDREIEELKEENAKLKKDIKFYEDALTPKESEDGKL